MHFRTALASRFDIPRVSNGKALDPYVYPPLYPIIPKLRKPFPEGFCFPYFQIINVAYISHIVK
jgi:hypothetical protein